MSPPDESEIEYLRRRNKEFSTVLTRIEERMHGLVAAFIVDLDHHGPEVNKPRVREMLREMNREVVAVLHPERR